MKERLHILQEAPASCDLPVDLGAPWLLALILSCPLVIPCQLLLKAKANLRRLLKPLPGRSTGGVAGMPGPAHALTLRGPVLPEVLGVTLAAEHLVRNGAPLHAPLQADAPPELRAQLSHGSLSIEGLADVRCHPYASLTNLWLEAKDATRELVRFARSGGGAVVGGTSCPPPSP